VWVSHRFIREYAVQMSTHEAGRPSLRTDSHLFSISLLARCPAERAAVHLMDLLQKRGPPLALQSNPISLLAPLLLLCGLR